MIQKVVARSVITHFYHKIDIAHHVEKNYIHLQRKVKEKIKAKKKRVGYATK
jgi:hypothetical protein